MKFKTYNEFVSWFNKLIDDKKIEIFNRYWKDVDIDNCIYLMSEFNQILVGFKSLQVAKLVERSESFTTNDYCFVITYLGDLVSYTTKEAIEYMKEKFHEQFDSEGKIEI